MFKPQLDFQRCSSCGYRMFIRKLEDFSSFDGFKWLFQVLVKPVIDYHQQYLIANDTIKTHRMALITPFQQQQDNDVRMWFFLECTFDVTLIAHPIETKWRIICTLARCTKKIKNTDKSPVVSFAPLACTETVAALMIWPRHQQHNIKLFIASRSEKWFVPQQNDNHKSCTYQTTHTVKIYHLSLETFSLDSFAGVAASHNF
jgi:hypothetical protein